MKYIKLFEAFTKLNEGGGAGIEFKIENVHFTGNLIITNGAVKVENPHLDLPLTFDAKGYQDGLTEVTTEIIGVDYENVHHMSWDKIKTWKIQPLYVDRNEFLEELFSREGESLSPELVDSIMTIEDIFKFLPDATLNVNIDYNLDYTTMVFGGWIRGDFKLGETLATANDWDGEHSSTMINDERLDEPNFSLFSFPTLKVTEQFIDFYHEVFKDRPDFEDEMEADDYYYYLKDKYSVKD